MSETLREQIIHGLRMAGWSRIDAENEADERLARKAELAERAERLTARINERLKAEEVMAGDHGNIGAVVADSAPGWDYAETSVIGDWQAKVQLTRFNPDEPF